MPWNNSWSGGGVVVASSVLVENNNNVVAEIDTQGNITGQIIYAVQDFFFKGVELDTYLLKFPLGDIGHYFINIPARSTVFAGGVGPERLLIQCTFTYLPNRRYYLHFNNSRMSSNVAGSNAWLILRMRLAVNGNVTITDPPGLWLDEFHFTDTAWCGYEPVYFEITGFVNGLSGITAGSNVNAAISTNGGNQTLSFFPGDNWEMSIIDEGPQRPDVGVDLYTASAPALQFRTFQITATDSQSYQGSGAASNGSGSSNTDRMYYGQDPAFSPNGNWRSYCLFDINSTAGGNGLGSLSNMNGATAGNLQYCDVFIYTRWWYQVAGGTLWIGYNTNATVNHSTEQAFGQYQVISSNFSGRGVGQWVSVLGTNIQTAILNGTFRGLILGPGPTTALAYYGYADGPAHSLPAIRAGYYK